MSDSRIEPITDNETREALDRACVQVLHNLSVFTDQCQNHSSVRGFYPPCDNDQWTTGFWPGEIWLAFEHTGFRDFKDAGFVFVDSFMDRIRNHISVDHHDMGFLYTPSCVSAWKLTGNQKAREAAILAAKQLVTRFQENGSFIQAWGPMGARENYRYIIDCLLNLPLLYWATEETGEARFADVANRHAETCLANSFRADWSTYHTFFMDPVTGLPDHGETCQGYKNDSSWARGQAWAVYGLALSFRHTGIKEYVDIFRNVSDYYLSKLPSDLVPYWDLVFTEGSTEPRDSSSAAIVSCGLLEMADLLATIDPDTAASYRNVARQMMKSLVADYSVRDSSVSNGQLLHGTYSKKSPFNTCTEEGVDECVAWGDYYYMEALTRLVKKWNVWW
jgi:unsaturated chondroitin disaccharide hydrolase